MVEFAPIVSALVQVSFQGDTTTHGPVKLPRFGGVTRAAMYVGSAVGEMETAPEKSARPVSLIVADSVVGAGDGEPPRTPVAEHVVDVRSSTIVSVPASALSAHKTPATVTAPLPGEAR